VDGCWWSEGCFCCCGDEDRLDCKAAEQIEGWAATVGSVPGVVPVVGLEHGPVLGLLFCPM